MANIKSQIKRIKTNEKARLRNKDVRSALLGSALAVKPLLQVVDGEVQPLEKVRTASRALARLQAIAGDAVGRGGVDAAVMHLGAEARAEHLAADLRVSLPGLMDLRVTELSAAVGAHTGSGALGLAVIER
jgi:fatty acid-binding protein DegV